MKDVVEVVPRSRLASEMDRPDGCHVVRTILSMDQSSMERVCRHHPVAVLSEREVEVRRFWIGPYTTITDAEVAADQIAPLVRWAPPYRFNPPEGSRFFDPHPQLWRQARLQLSVEGRSPSLVDEPYRRLADALREAADELEQERAEGQLHDGAGGVCGSWRLDLEAVRS